MIQGIAYEAAELQRKMDEYRAQLQANEIGKLFRR